MEAREGDLFTLYSLYFVFWVWGGAGLVHLLRNIWPILIGHNWSASHVFGTMLWSTTLHSWRVKVDNTMTRVSSLNVQYLGKERKLKQIFGGTWIFVQHTCNINILISNHVLCPNIPTRHWVSESRSVYCPNILGHLFRGFILDPGRHLQLKFTLILVLFSDRPPEGCGIVGRM